MSYMGRRESRVELPMGVAHLAAFSSFMQKFLCPIQVASFCTAFNDANLVLLLLVLKLVVVVLTTNSDTLLFR